MSSEQTPATPETQETPETRGAGTGENANATREREYNETVDGAFPAVISPTKEQRAAIREGREAEATPRDGAVLNPLYDPTTADFQAGQVLG